MPAQRRGRARTHTSCVYKPKHVQPKLKQMDSQHKAQNAAPTTPMKVRDGEHIGAYTVIKEIGSGVFGRVYQVYHTQTKQVRALKQMHEINARDMHREVATMESLRECEHPNIVRYIEHFELCIVLEYAGLGSLSAFMKMVGPLSESNVGSFTLGILHGLTFLHAQGIIHRDIKPDNVLITSECVVKIADFGIAIKQGSKEAKAETRNQSRAQGSFLAPESCAPELTTAFDIWSVGRTAIELFTGKKSHSTWGIWSGLQLPEGDDEGGASSYFQKFLHKCFVKNPEKRPKASALIEDEWFDMLNGRDSHSFHQRLCLEPAAQSAVAIDDESKNSAVDAQYQAQNHDRAEDEKKQPTNSGHMYVQDRDSASSDSPGADQAELKESLIKKVLREQFEYDAMAILPRDEVRQAVMRLTGADISSKDLGSAMLDVFGECALGVWGYCLREVTKNETENTKLERIDTMSDAHFKELLTEYEHKYNSPPSEIKHMQNFANQQSECMGQHVKYSYVAVRDAFERWQTQTKARRRQDSHHRRSSSSFSWKKKKVRM